MKRKLLARAFRLMAAVIAAAAALVTCTLPGNEQEAGGGEGGRTAFTAVTGITGVTQKATVGVGLTLTGEVEPADATGRTIVWTVQGVGDGITDDDVTLAGTVLTARATGKVTARATVENGKAEGEAYVEDFVITVGEFVPVTGITGVQLKATVGTALTLGGRVVPGSSATYKTIDWIVKSVDGAGITAADVEIAGNVLTAKAAGTVTVTAIVVNGLAPGKNYQQDFAVKVLRDTDSAGNTGSGTYTITWVVGDTRTTEPVTAGETPEYGETEGETPRKDPDTMYEYQFSGWEPALAAASADATYTAQFNPVPRPYTIQWVREGFDAPITDLFPYGTKPVYDIKINGQPVKEPDDQYTYTWKASDGWTPAVTTVTGPATYTAKFATKTRTYTVTWKNGDTTLKTQTVEYGTEPEYPGTLPAAPPGADTAKYTYTFAGWKDEAGKGLASVTGDVTYTAVYTATPKPGTGGLGITTLSGAVPITVDGVPWDGKPISLHQTESTTVTLSVPEADRASWTEPVWYVDGTKATTGYSLTLNAATYSINSHVVTFTGLSGGDPYSRVIPFEVDDTVQITIDGKAWNGSAFTLKRSEFTTVTLAVTDFYQSLWTVQNWKVDGVVKGSANADSVSVILTAWDYDKTSGTDRHIVTVTGTAKADKADYVREIPFTVVD